MEAGACGMPEFMRMLEWHIGNAASVADAVLTSGFHKIDRIRLADSPPVGALHALTSGRAVNHAVNIHNPQAACVLQADTVRSSFSASSAVRLAISS